MSEEFGIFERLLKSAVQNIAQSFYDDFCKKNASFRAKAGVEPKVIRKDDGKCCEWCSNLAGTYDYYERPDDIFRRHKNCSCTVVVEYSKNRYRNVWDQKDYQSEKEARIAQAKEMEELDKLSAHEKMLRRAELDAEYSRNYRKGMTQAQKEAALKRKRDAYHAKNPDSKYLTGGKYKGRDPLNSPATLNGKTGKELEDAISNKVHRKTGGLNAQEYAEYQRELNAIKEYSQLRLPPDEYAHIMSEINNNMSEEDKKHALIRKPIGNYIYTFINKGFDEYIIIDKKIIL
ncbi:MAG: hypothetical protein MJ086_03455 [Lachnospiraceae bacterium]|nr:hypothetical protein [Lachnospiraceae bacterium]